MLQGPAVVVLLGASGSGKSTWAGANFAQSEIVSTDALRAMVGTGESDQEASGDAFAVLRHIVEARCRRRLTTVVDTLGFDGPLRAWLRELASTNGLECHVVIFTTPSALCRERNRLRERRVPVDVMTAQFATLKELRDAVSREPFTKVHVVDTSDENRAPTRTRKTRLSKPTLQPERGVRFGLHLSSFPGPAETLRARMTAWAQAAEASGFDSMWVMDHFRQIPQAGREWDDMCESVSALSFLAGVTSTVTLGSLVHCVTHRNLGLLGKSLATVDVLSGGRAVCGLGIGWFEKEQRAYGIDVPSVRDRYALLEDALQFLPLLWGKGSPSFEGAVFSAPEAIGYPRPLQERIPMLVGGSGERHTLRLVAKHADACNFFGDAANVAHKLAVLDQHCRDVGRDRSTISVTHLRTALVGSSPDSVANRLDTMRVPKRMVATLNPGTVASHIEQTRALVEAGVDHVIVSLVGIDPDEIARYGEVIHAMRA